jgi:hypothetical protein
VLLWPFCAVLIGLAGNVLNDPGDVGIFAAYFTAVSAVVAIMFSRVLILRALLFGLSSLTESTKGLGAQLRAMALCEIENIGGVMIYFTRGDNVVMLNRAVLYVLQNEQTNRLEVVHVYRDESEIPPKLADDLKMLDALYPELRIDFTAVRDGSAQSSSTRFRGGSASPKIKCSSALQGTASLTGSKPSAACD